MSRLEGVIDITEREEELLNGDGWIDVREVVEPEYITITTEPTRIPPTSLELFYSDGMAQDKIVPAGTRLSNGREVISDEFFKDFKPYIDSNGEAVEGMYIRVIPARIRPNPYGMPVVKTNPNGFVIATGDSDCFFAETVLSDRFGLEIYTEEQVNKMYVPYTPKSKRINSFRR